MPKKKFKPLLEAKYVKGVGNVQSFDFIDCYLLMQIIEEPLPIMRITEKLSMAHKNVLQRINKLEETEMIFKKQNISTRQVFIHIAPKGKAMFNLQSNTIKDCIVKKNEMIVKF